MHRMVGWVDPDGGSDIAELADLRVEDRHVPDRIGPVVELDLEQLAVGADHGPGAEAAGLDHGTGMHHRRLGHEAPVAPGVIGLTLIDFVGGRPVHDEPQATRSPWDQTARTSGRPPRSATRTRSARSPAAMRPRSSSSMASAGLPATSRIAAGSV